MNTLYLGDCLYVLRENIPDESVDLIYIDPPFNSKRDYNIFFDDKEIQSQRVAFEDTWTLKNIQDSLAELHTMKTEYLYYLLLTYQKVAPHAFPYLTMMSLRLIELYRVLKPTGSFYLHCDPTMSHYLKTVCDVIFASKNFRTEISWKRSSAHSDAKQGRTQCGNIRDILLFYSKSSTWIWNWQYTPYDRSYIDAFYIHVEETTGRRYRLGDLTAAKPGGDVSYDFHGTKPYRGRYWAYSKDKMEQFLKEDRLHFPKNGGTPSYKRYLDEMPGVPLQNDWSDLKPAGKDEYLGYPTQKPKALLERIIKASSNEGDVVLDAFCGCGTTIDAAEGLHRKWIGIDISPIAISLIKRRLRHTYKKSLSEFEVRGIPTDEQSAMKIWQENPFAFQDWWISEFDVFSSTFGTKGADRGVDGIGLYALDDKGSTLRVAFQVKGGENVQSKDIDALTGAMSKHKCEMGVFLTAAEPTKPMLETAADSGFVKVPGFEYPKLQIITLEEYFSGKRPKLPTVNITFKAAQHTGKKAKGQLGLEME
jgi:site-specific DNA-methyltransferase (adenine-specific)